MLFLKLMKQGGAGQIFKMWWAFIGVQLPQRLVSISSGPGYERSAYMCLLAKSLINSMRYCIAEGIDPVKQNFPSADLTFDLWQQPIGNGRRYCKIQ